MELWIERKVDWYTGTELENKNIQYIKNRFTAMETQRKQVDVNWPLFQKMIDAKYYTYWDERSSSVVPLASALIELYVAEAKKLETEWNFKWETDTFKSQAKALEYAWKYHYRRNKFKKVFNDNEYICAAFWTAIMYPTVEKTFKIWHDPLYLSDWTYEWETKSIEQTKITNKDIDIRRFYIDDRATCIEDANDCIFIDYVSLDKILAFKWSSLYKNIQYVEDSTLKMDDTFTIPEDNSNAKYVKLTYYWNLEKDYFIVLANDNIIIREHYIINTANWEKALPFVIRWLWKKSHSIYHRWLCEPLMMFNSEVNNLREMLMDWIRRSNSQTLLLWNGLQFNWREFSYNNEILNFTWNLNWNFQQVSWNAPNQAIFSYMDRLYKDIAIYVWIDIQNIIWQPQQTAFQTEVQREAMQKRVNVWLENRDLAYERFADLYKDLLQTYFPYTLWYNWTPESIPEIQIEWWKFDANWNFKQIKWTSMFKVTPEILRWDIWIDVYTNTTAPTINAVDKAQKLDLIRTIWEFTNWYLLAKQAWEDIESIMPFKKTLEELANDFNITTTNNSDSQDLQAKKAEFMQNLQNMRQWTIWVPQQVPTEAPGLTSNT